MESYHPYLCKQPLHSVNKTYIKFCDIFVKLSLNIKKFEQTKHDKYCLKLIAPKLS